MRLPAPLTRRLASKPGEDFGLVRVLVLAGTVIFLSTGSALAQIYVVEGADGSRRYTNAYESGAKIFRETRHTPVTEVIRVAGPVPFRAEIDQAAVQAGVDARFVEAIIAAESDFDPHAVSKKGAQGLMQLMPATADRFAVRNVWDPLQNIVGGTTYVRELMDLYDGNLRIVLAAYNAGEGAVEKHGGVPPFQETRQYIERVLDYYSGLGGR